MLDADWYYPNQQTQFQCFKRPAIKSKFILTFPGIDINATNRYNDTVLICASRNGEYEIFKLLLTVPGIDVNAKNNTNKTALIAASLKGPPEIVKFLKWFQVLKFFNWLFHQINKIRKICFFRL